MLVRGESILDMILIAAAMELKTAIKIQSFQTIPEAIAQIPPSHVNRKLKEELNKTRNQENFTSIPGSNSANLVPRETRSAKLRPGFEASKRGSPTHKHPV